MNNLNSKIVKALKGTRGSLLSICEDLNISHLDIPTYEELGIAQCTHCNTWSASLIPDLDNNPICKYCVDLVGM